MARNTGLEGAAPRHHRSGSALARGGRGAGLALLIGGTAMMAAIFARPVAAAGRWLIEPGGFDEDALVPAAGGNGAFAGDSEEAEAGEESATPCALPDWHPRVDCGAADGLAARGLELPPGHPPIFSLPALPPGHPPVGGLPRGRTAEPRALPAPALPSTGQRGDKPLWI